MNAIHGRTGAVSRARWKLALGAALILVPAVASAAEAPVDQGVEIVVTAQRRAETVADVPIAISAFDGDTITNLRLDDVKDLIRFTPGFTGASEDSWVDTIAIRGIVSNDYGIGGDPSIGLFKDGVYQGRSGAAVTSLYDIERAEALRGPQGFLFGRNAISGAISVITAKPDPRRFAGHVYAGYGEADRFDLEAALNVPVTGKWVARIAIQASDYDGWVDNAFTPGLDDRLMGGSKQAVRASLRYAGDGLDVTLIAEHERRRLDGTPYRASDADREVLDYLDAALGQSILVRGDRGDVDSDLIDPREDGDITSVTALVEAPLGFATLSSITGYRDYRFFYSEDYDGTPLTLGNYVQRQRGSYLSQELRLVSPDKRRLTWSIGLSGYREEVRARFANEADETAVCLAGYGYADCESMTQDLYGTPFVPAPGGLLVDINDVASLNVGLSAYADVNYELAHGLQLGAGLRYTWDRKRFTLDIPPSTSSVGNVWTFTYFTDGPITAARSWDGVTPRFYARYQLSPSLSTYASITRGYKAGGFGSFTVEAPGAIPDYGQVPAGTIPDAFAPETVWSAEAGIKGHALHRRVQFDITGFRYVYSNLQTNFFNPATRTQEVINVGKVHGTGVEAALTLRPARWLEFAGNVTWTHTRKIGDRDCVVRDCGGLPNPVWASSGWATLRQPVARGEAWLQAEWVHRGRRRESFDWRGITRLGAYAAVNLRVGYKDDRGWELTAHVENLFDRRYFNGAENNGSLTPSTLWGVSQPRNIGAEFRWRFD